MNSMLSTCHTSSPLGEMLLVANPQGDALAGVYFERQKYFPMNAGRWREAPTLPLFRETVAQLRAYFAGERTAFDIPLAPAGTSFQRDVWSAIAGVPFGATITYAELARRAGNPTAIRAAGAANGRNPISIVIPCHRVVGTDGRLTGYSGGLDAKRWLLDHEEAGR